MSDGMWLVLVLGILVGLYVGQRVAEMRRARFDGNRLWQVRRNYRLPRDQRR